MFKQNWLVILCIIFVFPKVGAAEILFKCDTQTFKEVHTKFKPDLADICNNERDICIQQKTIFWIYREKYFESSQENNDEKYFVESDKPNEKGWIIGWGKTKTEFVSINSLTGDIFIIILVIIKI